MPRSTSKASGEAQETEARSGPQPKCPFCAMSEAFCGKKEEHSEFFEHLRKAEVEVLSAFRSLIDQRIQACEKPAPKKATKIKVD